MDSFWKYPDISIESAFHNHQYRGVTLFDKSIFGKLPRLINYDVWCVMAYNGSKTMANDDPYAPCTEYLATFA